MTSKLTLQVARVPGSDAKKLAKRELQQGKTAGNAAKRGAKNLQEVPGRTSPLVGKSDSASPFDIFRVKPDGALIWLQSEATLEAAKTRVEGFSARYQNEYLVLNRKTWTQFRPLSC